MKSLQQEILQCLEAKIIDVNTSVFLLEQLGKDSAFNSPTSLPVAPHSCSVCGGAMTIQKMTCQSCHATIEGQFSPCVFSNLTKDEHHLLWLFLKCRGNLKEMERELHVSYPTVRNRVETMLRKVLNVRVPNNANKDQILRGVEQNMFSVQDALAWFTSQYQHQEDQET